MRYSRKNLQDIPLFELSWRTKLAKVYTIICVCDFIVFPILWSIIQIYKGGEVTNAWLPITMANGGLLHISFGTILGVSAHAKMKERISYNETHTNHINITEDSDDRTEHTKRSWYARKNK